MPDPEPAITTRIEELITLSKTAFRAGDGRAAHDRLNDAWALLPEPKAQWDFYSQGDVDDRGAALPGHGFVR